MKYAINFRGAIILEERILSLYAVIASIVILKFLPRVDPVTHEKSRDKGEKQIRGN